MNILVTGGAGYLGKSLVSSLIKQGHAVRAFDLQPAPEQGPSACQFTRGDLLDPQSLGTALKDIEAIYHLAWIFRPDNYLREAEENLAATLNLLDACRASRVGHFIFASSAVVYGPTGEKPACEADPCHPERSTIGGPAYGVTKWACERYAMIQAGEGPPATVLRIHGVFSIERLAQFSAMIDQAKEAREIVAIAEAGGEYAHLDDVVWALCAVLGRDEALGEIFNVAGCRTYRDEEMAEYIAQKAGNRSGLSLVHDPQLGAISVSTQKLAECIGYSPRKCDFLRDFIDARFE
jgi:UDP-glucose 4-epimerase